MKQKNPYIAIYSLIFSCVILFMTLDIHLPSLPQITDDFKTTPFKAQLIFILSYCQIIFMPLLWGPLCDYIGRKKTLTFAMSIGLTGQVLCIFASSIDSLIAFRVVQYFGCGAIGSVTMSVICDLLHDNKRAKALALFEMTTPFALIIAPIIGAFTCELYGWRGNFILLALLQFVAFINILLFVPETLQKTKKIKFLDASENFVILLKNSKFVRFIFLLGFLEAGWIVFVANSSFFYIDKYGFTPIEFSYYQIIPVIVFFLGLSFYRMIVEKIGMEKLFNIGVIGYSLFGLGILLGISQIYPLSPNILVLLLCFGNIAAAIVSPGANTKALNNVNDEIIGTASSLINLVVGMVPGIFMLISSLFFDISFLPVFIFIFITVVAVFILWISLLDYKSKIKFSEI